jgi:hypothetical protein
MKARCSSLTNVVLTLAAVISMSGCGRRTGAGAGAVSLPEWAPKNPSPEFLRAARALKPPPPERVAGLREELRARYRGVLCPASYGFFGTLTDQQMQEFLAAKGIRIPVSSLTTPQRAALNSWFAAFRDAMKGGPPQRSDYLAILYNTGAKEDLSNVQVGFVGGGWGDRGVYLTFWLTAPGGKEHRLRAYFAEL